MVTTVVTTQPHKSLGHVKDIMTNNKISAVPVVNTEGEPVGIVTSNDLHLGLKDSAPVSQVLSGKVYQVPKYNDVSVAAKIMRKHHIHHVLVTHEHKLEGIISSFDLLKLMDEHRFKMTNPPSKNKHKKEY